MKTLIFVLFLMGTTVHAQEACNLNGDLSCARCDPGVSHDATKNGGVRCFDCTTAVNNPSCIPRITCVQCFDAPMNAEGRISGCSGCTLVWQP